MRKFLFLMMLLGGLMTVIPLAGCSKSDDISKAKVSDKAPEVKPVPIQGGKTSPKPAPQ
jgi:hypothetical protein